MNSEQLQLMEWRVRLVLYPQYGARPNIALHQACLDSDIILTAPMEKYPSSYIHSAKKWLNQEVAKLNIPVIKTILRIDEDLTKRAKILNQ